MCICNSCEILVVHSTHALGRCGQFYVRKWVNVSTRIVNGNQHTELFEDLRGTFRLHRLEILRILILDAFASLSTLRSPYLIRRPCLPSIPLTQCASKFSTH